MVPIAAVEKSHRRRPIRATIGAGVEMFGRRASSPEDLFPPDRTAAVEGTNSGCHAVIPPSGRVRSPAPLSSVRPRHHGDNYCQPELAISDGIEHGIPPELATFNHGRKTVKSVMAWPNRGERRR